ncbi:hypothetical protein [Schaalia sp. Marseille-Q2122]|uniref:hypothetical protein n=1 Tax=Schaalia sp. Marseille-Q2122 TaxID=2736604 RepID=UPI0034C6B4D5
MAKTPNFDADKIKAEAAQLREAVAVHAGRAAVKATDLASAGLDWAAPRAQQALENAIDRATPLLSEAADRAQAAAERAKPVIEDARERVIDDYLPRINRAAHDATVAVSSDGALLDRVRSARDATAVALTTPTKKARKPRRLLRALGWTALGAGVAGAGYVLWKRSQPIEDPWAEEYWADLESEVDIQEMLPESVDEVVDAAADKVEEVKDAAAKKAEELKDAAEDAAEAAADKVDEVVEDVKDAVDGK